MHEYPFDNSIFLGKSCHIHETLIRVSAVLADDVFHPVALVVDIIFIVFPIPKLDFCSCYRYVDNAYMVFRRKNINHFSSEKIHRTEVVAFTTDRRYGSIPFSHLAPKFRHVDRSHELETWIIEIFVLLCRYSSCFHVGLSYTKINEKIGVRFVFRSCRSPENREYGKYCHYKK